MHPWYNYALEMVPIIRDEIEKERILFWDRYSNYFKWFEEELRKAPTPKKRHNVAIKFELLFPVEAPFDLRAKVRLLREGLKFDIK